MTTTKQFDSLNRLTQISSVPSAAYTEPATFNYTYNGANQRVQDTLADGSYWIYQYDSLGQVTNGVKYFPDNSQVSGQSFAYLFDNIGNRTETMSSVGTASYSANSLNQITSRDVPPYVNVLGTSYATNLLTVNGQNPYRHGEYFQADVPVNNSASPLWTNMIVTANVGGSVTGHVYVAQEPESLSYDADGNLVSDGRFTYSWDAENRLTNITSLSSAPTGSKLELAFIYDWQGRRIQKSVFTNSGSAYVLEYTDNFLYDGWNLLATLNPQLSTINSFLWGSDLSGSTQGAGGVGGLLEVINYGSGTNFVAFDGNGNVAALVNAADGTLTANYEYGPFGEPIRMTGTQAKANPFRFSTKYDDDESDLLYYGYRYYKPSTGTWPNRDPMGELGFTLITDGRQPFVGTSDTDDFAIQLFLLLAEPGGPNRYGFVGNDPVDKADAKGKAEIRIEYQDGTHSTIWNPTLAQLQTALQKAITSGNLIDRIFIKGHGAPDEIWIKGGGLCSLIWGGEYLEIKGRRLQGSDGTDFTPLFQGATTSTALVAFNGCETGRGNNNLAQQTSVLLPNRVVAGGAGLAQWGCPCSTRCVVGKKNYYINGQLENSTW